MKLSDKIIKALDKTYFQYGNSRNSFGSSKDVYNFLKRLYKQEQLRIEFDKAITRTNRNKNGDRNRDRDRKQELSKLQLDILFNNQVIGTLSNNEINLSIENFFSKHLSNEYSLRIFNLDKIVKMSDEEIVIDPESYSDFYYIHLDLEAFIGLIHSIQPIWNTELDCLTINDFKTPKSLNKLKDLGIYLTGSNFFNAFNKEYINLISYSLDSEITYYLKKYYQFNSDIDYFTEYKPGILEFFLNLGFELIYDQSDYEDEDLVGILTHPLENIDIQIVKDSKLKIKAQEYLFAYFQKLDRNMSSVEKKLKPNLWNKAFQLCKK